MDFLSDQQQKPQISILLSTFQSEKFLPHQLATIEAQSIWGQAELIIAANDPSPTERAIFESFAEKWPERVKVIVVPRESLYASWNRCILASKVDLLAIANVDDIRTPQSLEQQVARLEKSPEASFCYGPFSIVNQFPAVEGRKISPPLFDPVEFTRSMHLGPFFIWRKAVHEKIGYFDEQFRSGGDFDFAIRLALQGTGVRTNELLGYYYNSSAGLSTGSDLQPIERTMIELRYGIYDKLNYDYLPDALQYNISHYYWNGEWHSIRQLMPEYEQWISKRRQKWFDIGITEYANRIRKIENMRSTPRLFRKIIGPIYGVVQKFRGFL